MNKQQSIENVVTKLRSVMAFKHMGLTTKKAYVYWARQFVLWLFSNADT